jgi:hypothetical protein
MGVVDYHPYYLVYTMKLWMIKEASDNIIIKKFKKGIKVGEKK